MSIAAVSLAGCGRYALDRQMEELCKKDGGIKVYQTMTLSPSEYDAVFNYVAKHKTQEDGRMTTVAVAAAARHGK